MLKVYDYICTDCVEVFEKFVKQEQRDNVHCPTCGQLATRKMAAPSFHLRGSDTGFPTAAMKWEREHERAGKDTVDNARKAAQQY